jgi:hypothetical protein
VIVVGVVGGGGGGGDGGGGGVRLGVGVGIVLDGGDVHMKTVAGDKRRRATDYERG